MLFLSQSNIVSYDPLRLCVCVLDKALLHDGYRKILLVANSKGWSPAVDWDSIRK